MNVLTRSLPLLASLLLPAAFAAEGMTPEHVAKLRNVSSVALSPDGAQIAYVLSVPRAPNSDANGPAFAELHVVGRDGNARPYVTGEVNVGSVEFTPDGGSISFLAKRKGDDHRALYVIPLGGGEARKVLEHDTDVRDYSWSPDGARVAFLATDETPPAVKKLRDKGFNAEVYEEDPRFTRAYVADVPAAEGAKPRKLELEGNVGQVLWSPKGDRLALTLSATPFIDDTYMGRELHVADLDGALLARVEHVGKLGAIEWSPDGTRLAFIGAADLNDPQEGRLFVASAQGGKAQDVLPALAGHVHSIAWRDASTLAYLADVGVWTQYGTVGADGQRAQVLLAPGTHVLRGLAVAGAHAAALLESPTHPAEVALLTDAGAPRRITDSNPWLADVALGAQEVVTYAARDGMQLDGILIRPLDGTTPAPHPFVLVVHGGPEAHFSNGWLTRYSYPGQVGAANGFAVFYPNYRGSTGRGVEFSKLGQADYAGAEFDDLIDAIDHFVQAGVADAKKVGVTGGSYGGYATAWLSTKHTDKIAAGVMFVGISDLISKTGTSDIPNEMHLVHARKWLWEDWDYFVERSPIRWVEQARTPLLILHGKDDPRVHPGQSLELYRHLKVLGKTPVRLVYYPGEGHGLSRANGRYDYNLRMMRWFEHYLKGPGGAPPAPEVEYGFEKKTDESTARARE